MCFWATSVFLFPFSSSSTLMDPLPHSFYLSQRSSSRMSDDETHNSSNSRMSDTEEGVPPSSLSSSSTINAMMIPGRSGSMQLGRNRHHPYHRHHHRRHSSSSCSSSSLSSTPLSPTSSFNKMSVDSDDGGRTVSSSVGSDSKQQHRNGLVPPPPPITTAVSSNVASPVRTYQMGIPCSPTFNSNNGTASKQPPKQPASLSNRPSSKEKIEPTITPERRTVRRTSLLLKSKALSRVMHQAEEETHLADLEMRREGGTTQKHLCKASPSTSTARMDDHHPSSLPPPPPSPYNIPISSHSPWPHPHAFFPALNGDQSNNYQYSSSTSSSLSSSPTAYQCSRLNPEIEMTHFQFENLPSPMQSSFKSIKRKGNPLYMLLFIITNESFPLASEDRLWDGGLKRRAVSPSVSLSGSPTLTASPPPTASLSTSSILSSPSSSYLYPTGGNAAARPSSSNSAGAFNLHEASGGLSRMSLS